MDAVCSLSRVLVQAVSLIVRTVRTPRLKYYHPLMLLSMVPWVVSGMYTNVLSVPM